MKRTCFLAAFLLCVAVQNGFAQIDTASLVAATVKGGTNSVNGDREFPKNSQRRRESKLNGRTL